MTTDTLSDIIDKFENCGMDAGKKDGAMTMKQASKSNVTFSNGRPGSELAKKANLLSRYYTVNNISQRLVKACKEQEGYFTVSQMKHCTDQEEHYRLLMCFPAGQSSKVEVFVIHSTEGLLDDTHNFPDLTKGYTFETKHSTLLNAATLFTSPQALKDSAVALVELFRLDDVRTQNKDGVHCRDQILENVIEQHRRDGGILREPSSSDETWAIAFERPGSDIMQRTGINTKFYRVDDVPEKFVDCLKFSDSHVNVLPMKFVQDDGSKWIAMMCFGDKDGCLTEVNVIDLETRSLLMTDDDKDFPRLDEGAFVPIFPPGRVLRSKNKFVDSTSLGDKIRATANAIMDAMSIVERMQNKC